MRPHRDAILDWYGRYLGACNSRDWDDLGTFVADVVVVNGAPRSRSEYIEDLRTLVRAFPDYSWELQRAVVESEWLAVHLHDRGTRRLAFMGAPGDGHLVETDEFALYRLVDGLIHEVHGGADNARLQARGPVPEG